MSFLNEASSCGCQCGKANLDPLDDFIFVENDEALEINCDNSSGSPVRFNKLAQDVLVPAVMAALTTVTSRKGLLVSTVAKTMLTGAATSVTAGALGGLPGVAIGVVIAGGMLVYKSLKKTSLLHILKILSQQQQRQLICKLGTALKGLRINNMAKDILERKDVQDMALSVLSNYLTEKFGLKITQVNPCTRK